MFQGLSIPLAAKFSAAAVVVGGAGVATYEVVDDGEPTTVLADAPDNLAFTDAASETRVDGTRGSEATDKVEEPEHAREENETKEHDEPESDAVERHEAAQESDEKVEDEHEPVTVADREAHIEILWPEENSHYEQRKVVFEGTSEPDSKVFAGPYAADVDDAGNWRIELILSPGANTAKLTAEDGAGNVAEDSVTVWLDVEEPDDVDEKDEQETEKDDDVIVEFSANQQYGSCGEEIPYDVYWGTATPNTLITISSPYGGANIDVNEKGHWEKKVVFETAPRGEVFLVTVSGENGSKSFEFIAVPLEEASSEGDGEHAVGEEPK